MKQSRKAMKTSLINEVYKQNKSKFDFLKKQNQNLFTRNSELNNENFKLKNENQKLQDKLNHYKKAIKTLQEYSNLSDEEKEQLLNRYKIYKKFCEMFASFSPYFSAFM